MRKLFQLIVICIFLQSLTYAQTEVWGVTSPEEGDKRSNFGIIFKTDEAGDNFTIQKTFTIESDGKEPQQLMQAADGMLYGVTRSGGLNGKGVLYQFNPHSSVFTKKFDFVDSLGAYPVGALTEGNDGMLYGVTMGGGVNKRGVVYMFNPLTSVYIKRHDIPNSLPSIRDFNPSISLIKTSDGVFHGKLTGYDKIGDPYNLMYSYNSSSSIFSPRYGEMGWCAFDMLSRYDSILYSINSLGQERVDILYKYNLKSNLRTRLYTFHPYYRASSSPVQISDSVCYGLAGFRDELDEIGSLYKFNLLTGDYNNILAIDSLSEYSKCSNNLVYVSNKYLYGLLFKYNNNSTPQYKISLFQYNILTGAFTVKHDFNLTDSTYFGNKGSLTFVNKTITSIAQSKNNSNKILVYPNPTSGSLTVKLSTETIEASTIKIIDMLGKIIMPLTKKVGSTFTIDLANQPNGMYFLEVNENKNIYNIKIIKN